MAGVEGRLGVCSAASACLTSLTTAARKAGEGWSNIGDWEVADGSAEPVLGKLEFAAELDGLLSTGEINGIKSRLLAVMCWPGRHIIAECFLATNEGKNSNITEQESAMIRNSKALDPQRSADNTALVKQ